MHIHTPLMHHQKVIVDFLDDKPYAGIFADYGLGKTLAALADIASRKFVRILVVSTKTAIESTWIDEIQQRTDARYVMLLGPLRTKQLSLLRGIRLSRISPGFYHSEKLTPVIFLVNFDGVKNIFEDLVEAQFDCVIVDESTKIKSPQALRTKVLWKFGESVKHKIIMTGFPITENLQDLYAQIKFLDGGEALGTSYFRFMDMYFTKVGMRYFPKKRKIAELIGKIKPFCIRITNDVLKLPPKIYKKQLIQPTAQQLELLENFRNEFRLEFGKVKLDTQYVFALVNKSLQICDGFIQDNDGNLETIGTPKDETLLDILEEINVGKNKVIIWCAFRFSIAKIAALLKQLKIPTVQLTGSTTDVNAIVSKFQHDKTTNVLVATQKKAAESITLSNCRYAIYYSNTWSNDSRSNSEARIRRKGSEHHTSIVYTDFITKGTVEQQVYDCLIKKKNLVDELKETFGKHI